MQRAISQNAPRIASGEAQNSNRNDESGLILTHLSAAKQQDPKVTWETGVSTFGQVSAYGAVGAVAGAAGGALVGMAAQKALS